MTLVRLEPAAPRSRVKYSTYEPLRSPFNQTCDLWKSKRKATQSMPLLQTCQLKLWNFSGQDYCNVDNARYMPAGPVRLHCYVAAAATKYVFWSSVTSINTTAVQTCLLVEWCARWVLAGPLPLNQYACQSFTTQPVCLPIFYHSISMPADLLPLIPACLLYLPYLRVWCLTISHAWWCGASL